MLDSLFAPLFSPIGEYSVVAAKQGGGAAPVPVIPAGSTFGWAGDGNFAITQGAGTGLPNPIHVFEAAMSGRLQPVAAPLLGKSSATIARLIGGLYAWINPFAIDALAKQRPNVFILGSMGHNDGIKTSDPASSTPMQDWKDAVTYAYSKFTAYAGSSQNYIFAVFATIASGDPAETTWRSAVWAAQAAFMAPLMASDARIVFIDVSSMLPMTDYSIDSTANYTHIDERGGAKVAALLKNAIDSRVEGKTVDQILDMIYAGTYPLMSGSQLDSDRNLVGTGGTLTGVTSTGGIATSKLIQNTTGATVTAEMVTITGSQKKIVATLSGTSSAAGKVMIGDKSNLAISSPKPGQVARTGMRIKSGGGFHNYGADWAGNILGVWGGGANSIANNTRVGAGAAAGPDGIITINEFPFAGASATGKRNFSLYYRTGTALSGTIEASDFFAYLVSERGQYPAAYLGDVKDGNNVVFFATNSQRIRMSGTISAATGGTARVDPGLWVPRGATEADFQARRFYKGTSSDTAVGSGTLLGSVNGSSWTLAIAGGAAAQGDIIWSEIDLLDPFDGTTVLTRRCALADALTVAA
ncbi:hypothetical protein RLEG12_18705 [Rhizobium leguminosarum bv. trifolii CB782]|nr:hypothetical protein RLEG12_18705 [Rhizobium leguminosarum bv. trifolii CB782]